MKHIITAFVFVGILISCNSSDKTKTATQESSAIESETKSTSNDINKQLKNIDTDEALIATALMAAPKESRSKCKVIGYNMAGEFVTLKEGDNEFIILADNPNQAGFSAACYHEDLEPFMARGRALRAEGKTEQEVFTIREAEMKSGQLKITPGLTLQIYYGQRLYMTLQPQKLKVRNFAMWYICLGPHQNLLVCQKSQWLQIILGL
jgi:hypothetical protein